MSQAEDFAEQLEKLVSDAGFPGLVSTDWGYGSKNGIGDGGKLMIHYEKYPEESQEELTRIVASAVTITLKENLSIIKGLDVLEKHDGMGAVRFNDE